ncbi:unnamed protein product [Meloidogyne enterolobii]|uniref:Uncharacterized protein n=1 Tax=Meloidogyne enterolobii TaxID=390850 RepID=A0ACB0ZK88_MELEN
MIKYRNLLWKKINKPEIRDKYLALQQKIDKETSKFFQNREMAKFKDPRSKFQYIGAFLKTKKTKIPTFKDHDHITLSDLDKADKLAKQFQSVFNSTIFSNDDIVISQAHSLSFIDIIPQEIFNIISNLDNVNNASPDGIPNIFLKNTAISLTSPLVMIFNYSIMTKKIPNIWKKSIICPIPKISNPKEPIDFRPISLLCSTSKILEYCITKEITNFLESNKLIPTNQHGFRKNRSVTTQLLETFDDYTQAIEQKKCVDVIFFDLAKAFDTVPHVRLLKKLEAMGITDTLLHWLTDYLKDRSFSVQVESTMSEEYNITSGVPQGSMLGPILFIAYISDIVEFCKTSNVIPKLFADDLKAYSIFDSTQHNHYSPLQNFINKISTYCTINGLKISINKCKSFHIGSKNPYHVYSLDNSPIPTIQCNENIRDLGIHFTPDLKWESHIKIIAAKATRTYFTLIRSLKTKNPNFLITLFKIYVLPILEFGSPVFDPYLQKDIHSLENVQKKFLQIVYSRSGKYKNTKHLPDYHKLLKLFQLEPLSHRRLKSSLILFHNILSGKIESSQPNYITRPTITRGNPHNIFIPFCSTTIRKNSFFVKIPDIYRKLPIDIQKASTDLFPKLLNSFDLSYIFDKNLSQ